SVAHPAPVMQAYIEVRVGCETLIREAGLRATILRPWYVLGPGSRWPVALIPLYWMAAAIPRFAEGARRLGLVSLEEMVGALVRSIENPAEELRILEPADIRASARNREIDALLRKEQ
ncbi:MAG TPA: epimerase, partial [Candidatus Dormibacteraeota bacterium]|nr:epimerase [Candidatus Dormibacteraeota bacterium]